MSEPPSSVETWLKRPFLSGEDKNKMLHALLDEMPAPAPWSLLQAKFGEALDLSGQIPVGDLMRDVCQEIVDGHEGEPIEAPLAQFTLESVHHPRLEALMNGAPLFTAQLEVTLSLDVDAVRLTLHDGKVEKIATGGCSCSLSIALTGIKKPLTFTSPDMRFPGEILLSPPTKAAP
jgi:hypothetical protein